MIAEGQVWGKGEVELHIDHLTERCAYWHLEAGGAVLALLKQTPEFLETNLAREGASLLDVPWRPPFWPVMESA